jgi:hypothetical protein
MLFVLNYSKIPLPLILTVHQNAEDLSAKMVKGEKLFLIIYDLSAANTSHGPFGEVPSLNGATFVMNKYEKTE